MSKKEISENIGTERREPRFKPAVLAGAAEYQSDRYLLAALEQDREYTREELSKALDALKKRKVQ